MGDSPYLLMLFEKPFEYRGALSVFPYFYESIENI